MGDVIAHQVIIAGELLLENQQVVQLALQLASDVLRFCVQRDLQAVTDIADGSGVEIQADGIEKEHYGHREGQQADEYAPFQTDRLLSHW